MMIPLELQDELVKRLEEEFNNETLLNRKKEETPLKIFSQHLPSKSKNNHVDPYPCVVVRIPDGSQNDENQPAMTTMQFVVGVVDRSNDNQGYRDALRLTNRVIESLKRKPMISGKYELSLPINWSYVDDDAEPYFFAGLETTWRTPKYLREDVEEMI